MRSRGFREARRAALVLRGGGICYLCLEGVDVLTVTREHRIPLSRGGHNVQANVAAACGRCNSLKGDMTEAEFRAAYPTLEAIVAATSPEVRRARRRAKRARRRLVLLKRQLSDSMQAAIDAQSAGTMPTCADEPTEQACDHDHALD